MFRLGYSRRAGLCLSLMALAAAGCLFPQNARAGIGSITGTAAGATPFISNVSATYSGGTLQSVAYGIVPKTGSLTRPLVASYSAQYLTSTGTLQGNSLTIPVFGLYAGYTNSVSVYFYFTDGTVSLQTINITTAAYSDPCTQLNSPTLTQSRVNTSDLGYDFFVLKDICSTNDPAIVDTDGNIRWVGQASDGTSAVAIYNNAIYLSDGKTGILRILLTNDSVTKIGDYAAAPYNVTYTGHHNIDPGRNGLIVDVNTSAQTEAVDLEINPNTGAVINSWDLGQIISYTMTKGGDNPAKFVLGTSADWFHNNATAYNPADNTLIVSSRENFVIAVDYDTPADGQKKIHWILGDTSKAWYQFPSLKAFMLRPTNAATLPPIGQHAVSIDHLGNLLLFDDGYQSLTQSPAGISRSYSAIREYQINTSAMTATQGPIYYSPSPAIDNEICGSVYDVGGTYLVDFPVAQASGQGNTSGNVILQGLGTSENLVFNLQYAPNNYCNGGWNAYPISSNTFTFTGSATSPSFNLSVTPAALALVAPQSGQVAVNITPLNGFAGAVSLTAAGLPSGVTSSFSSSGTTGGSTLTITAAASTVAGTYPITITGTSGTLSSTTVLNLTVSASASAPQGPVSLASEFNIYGIFNNGSAVTNGGLDTSSYAYSANLLGTSLTFNGVSYSFGTAGTANAVSSATLALPAGSYKSLNFVGTAIYGPQASQTFIVTYTDGTTTNFTQSLSDWGYPQKYAGESIALTMSYRLTQTGAQQTYPFNLYAYSFALNSAKTVKSITLPNSRNVVVLAVTLSSGASAVSLGSAANVYGAFNDGSAVTNGGLDTASYAYSANLLGTALTFNGVSYSFGTAGTVDAVSSSTLALPAGSFKTLSFLGTAIYGPVASQAFVVTYTDGTTTSFTQSLSDWGYPQNYPGESIALTMPYRLTSTGAQQTGPWCLYAYSLALNSAKTVKSITLPNSRNVVVLAVTLSSGASTVSLGSAANVNGIFNNGSAVTNGGLDSANYAYSANLLGTSLTFNGVSYSFGAAGAVDAVSSSTLALPAGIYKTLSFLGTGIFGPVASQAFVVTYTDGTSTTFTQSLSDWGSPQNYAGESVALTMPYRLTSSGAQQTGPWYLYAYSFALNSAKTVKSITLPNNRNVVALAFTLTP